MTTEEQQCQQYQSDRLPQELKRPPDIKLEIKEEGEGETDVIRCLCGIQEEFGYYFVLLVTMLQNSITWPLASTGI
jgi:hypothetical protein